MDSDKPLEGRTVLVTGANSGIGRATAEGLAELGASVVLGCRNEEEGQKARVEIKEKTGNDQLDLLIFDLSDLQSVSRAAESFKKRYNKLDVLINNAGFMGYPDRRLSKDGNEIVLATNYLGHFALTLELLDYLMSSADGRIINLSSYTHRIGRINWGDFQYENGYKAINAYAKSKLMMVLFTKYLADRLALSNLTVNAVDPGTVYTSIDKSYTKGFQLMYKIGRPFMRNTKKGAVSSIFLASHKSANKYNGELFKDSKPIPAAAHASNKEDILKLWEVSLELTGLDDPFEASPN
jgi:NAD(P)-dependent dehydrogenase (short-subunit alcohol dehydrogenase family)